MLYQIIHDKRSKLWCGPGAIAIVTGEPTSVIHRIIADGRGGGIVKGVYNREVLHCLDKLGFGVVDEIVVGRKLTLARFVSEHRQRFAKVPMIVEVGHHYVVLLGNRFVDNQIKDPVLISDMKKFRRARVNHAWAVARVKPAAPPPPPPAPAPSASRELAQARRIADKHGIIVERYMDDLWVRYGPSEAAGDDPYEGDHICDDGAMALDRVLGYVEYIAAKAGAELESAFADLERSEPFDPQAPIAAHVERVLRRRPMSPMQIACELSVGDGLSVREIQVRGAVLHLVRRGRARYLRGKVKLLEAA